MGREGSRWPPLAQTSEEEESGGMYPEVAGDHSFIHSLISIPTEMTQ